MRRPGSPRPPARWPSPPRPVGAASAAVEVTPRPDDLAEDQPGAHLVAFDRDQGVVPTRLVGPEDQVPPADVEPTEHRGTVGAGGDHPSLETLGVGDGPVD